LRGLWKEIAAQATSDLASIILSFFFLAAGSVWLQMIVDPAREDGRLRGCPWLRKSLDQEGNRSQRDGMSDLCRGS